MNTEMVIHPIQTDYFILRRIIDGVGAVLVQHHDGNRVSFCSKLFDTTHEMHVSEQEICCDTRRGKMATVFNWK